MSSNVTSISDSSETNGTVSQSMGSATKLYRKRYLILVLFVLLSMSNAFQWIEYAIIENIITDFYNTTTFWVNCTSVVYMAAYIVGIIPATYLLDTKGLRFCVLMGAFGNSFGSIIKCFSVDPNRFWVTMIGQSVVAASQLFILSIPPLLAAVWFSEKEVSRATSYGVFGNQVGIALGFFVPGLLVPNYSKHQTQPQPQQYPNSTEDNSTAINSIDDTSIGDEEVGNGLKVLFIGVAVFTTLLFVAILLLFKDKPDLPPSTAQANAQQVMQNMTYFNSIKALATNPNFILLFFTYGLNTGVFYAVSTVLNQMVTGALGDDYVKEAGYMGFTLTLAGILGSIVCGFLLDWTRCFKEITLGVYLFSLLGIVAFTIALQLKAIWFMFLVSGVLGFFMTGYLPLGFELAAEITYPQPEGTSAGLLNAAAQIFGVIFTFGGSAVIDAFNSLTANIGFVCALVLGSVLTAVIKADLKRQAAEQNKHYMNSDSKLLNRI